VEEIIIERREPGKLVRPSMWGSSMSASAAYYKSRGSKSTVLDSVVAVVFLVTLSVGLWQWLNSPVDSSSSQPSSVTVELENVLLRPVPSAAMSSARDLTRGGSSSYTIPDRTRSFLQIEAEPIVGFSAPVPRKEPIGQPGSAVLESKRRRSPPAPALPQATSKPAASEQPSGPNLASAAQAATAAATQIAEQAREAADTVAAPPTALDLEGMLLQKVLPVYPTHARRQGLEGQVVLQAVIGKDGNIAQLRPLQGPQELTQAAIDAVQHWRFRPYEMNGKPVEVETDIRLNFQLPKK
jgi:TonB family protein